MTSLDDTFGWIGGGLAIVYNLPQILHVYRTKEVKGLSSTSLVMRIASYVFIVVHGYVKKDSPILMTTLVGLFQICVIQAQIWYYSMQRRQSASLEGLEFPTVEPP